MKVQDFSVSKDCKCKKAKNSYHVRFNCWHYTYEWYTLNFRNIPHIHLHEKRDLKEHWHGAEIQVVIAGNWTTYRVRTPEF